MSEHTKGLIAINIAALVFGSAALYGKLNVSPLWIVSMRGLFASATLLMVGTARKEIVHPKTNIKSLAITGIILALHWLTFFWSVQLSGVAIATLTFAAYPLFTLIIEALKNKKHLNAIEIAAGLVIIFVVALLVKIDSVSTDVLIGTISGIASAVLFALFGIISQNLTVRLPTLTVSFVQNFVVCSARTCVCNTFRSIIFCRTIISKSCSKWYFNTLGIIITF